jgi:hypothetical protein
VWPNQVHLSTETVGLLVTNAVCNAALAAAQQHSSGLAVSALQLMHRAMHRCLLRNSFFPVPVGFIATLLVMVTLHRRQCLMQDVLSPCSGTAPLPLGCLVCTFATLQNRAKAGSSEQ